MTFLLACAALILLLTGHWGWALTVLLLLLLLSPSEKTPSGTGNTPSPKLASYAPEERHEHPAARVRRETTLTPLVRPSGPADADYGVDAFAFHDWLASPDVMGTPAGGLEAGGEASGMTGYNVAAGVKGELSVAHMLASKDLKGARVYLSCRNPGDASGAADIDVIVATGRTVWLLDAKHYAPARDGMWLVPTTADPGSWKPYGLRAYGPDANVEGVPLASLDGIAPDRSYHASGNMAWAADEIRKGPARHLRPSGHPAVAHGARHVRRHARHRLPGRGAGHHRRRMGRVVLLRGRSEQAVRLLSVQAHQERLATSLAMTTASSYSTCSAGSAGGSSVTAMASTRGRPSVP